jgi:flagellar basal-body rod protein FlgG
MVRGLYQGSGAMQYLIEKTDVIGNNIANSSTNGFKRQGVFFRQLIDAEQALENDQIHTMETAKGDRYTMQLHRGCNPPGTPYTPEGDISTYTDFTEGGIRETGNPLDVAITGEGYFVVETPQGTAYTRDGQFKVDRTGKLVTAQGYPVSGEGGPIQITGEKVSIAEDGTISVDGNRVNKLALRAFDEEKLVQNRDGLVVLPESNTPQSVEPHVQQGMLETSNVNPVREMVEMIAAQRHYDANSKVIQTIDSSLQKSVNDIGRV